MKLLTSITLILFSMGLYAQVNSSDLPPCSSPLVRYSKAPVQCQNSGEINTSRVFEIPSERLDIEDIRRMFEAAESSGGGRPRPSTGNEEEQQQQQQENPIPPAFGFNFELQCDLRMVNDSNLTVLLLSTYKLQFSNENYEALIYSTDLNHFLSPNRSFDPSVMTPIPANADISTSDIYIELSKQEYSEQDDPNVNLEMCISTVDGRDRCLSSGFDKDQKKINETIAFLDIYGVKKSIELNCNIKSRD